MKIHEATEQAYKNGYEKGRQDAVKHGRWVDRYGGKYVNPVYDCSECKKSALFRNDMDLLGNWKSVQYLSDYCPNCGARMDGDGQ